MKFCSNCGNQVPEGAKVCPLCGTPIGGQPNFQQQTQNQQPNQNYQAAARPVVQNKSLATCIILSLVTCGIYGIIWFINMVDDVNRYLRKLANPDSSSISMPTQIRNDEMSSTTN